VTFRNLILLLAVTAAASLPLGAATKDGDIAIVRVFTGWREASSFKYISEYFTGRENTHGEVVLRTQPGQRGGYYFLVRIANPGASIPVTFKLQLILPTGHKVQEQSFATELKSGATVFNLGLTGSDWPNPKANPVAWKLDLLGSDGRLLATEKSYLWEKPASN
jgi:hypothetical protein